MCFSCWHPEFVTCAFSVKANLYNLISVILKYTFLYWDLCVQTLTLHVEH